ncbi:methyltransferase N6AMT1-like isoform X1 [Leptopilina heterotoma]|uniref:methyltransferase N6AMT1-like isoform X1 n=1 Tax=Leptopilina heterotoma TaxID=63436 RepID=UPI001CA97C39|nr:methyltransferase N6AMT1-like isoform X1 [Leptopilina heterotoma]
METPIVKLSDEDRETVYEPSEDSFLLIDALESDLQSIDARMPGIGLEIGSGSGVVITALAMALGSRFPSYFLATDINPNACKVTKKTSVTNSTKVEVIQMDLATNFLPLKYFDLIVFNPPYVVTEALEVFDEKLISKTWAGGLEGRQVMKRIFPHIPNLLSENGIFYLLIIKENNPEYIMEYFKQFNMIGSMIAERKIRGEHLYVLKFVRHHDQ